MVAYLTKPKPFDLPETLSVTTFASRTLPKGANAPWSFSSVVNLERPLTKSLGVVSGGTLATSVPSPNMEDGGDEPKPVEEQKAARSMEAEAVAGVELQKRRRSRAGAAEEAAMAVAGSS